MFTRRTISNIHTASTMNYGSANKISIPPTINNLNNSWICLKIINFTKNWFHWECVMHCLYERIDYVKVYANCQKSKLTLYSTYIYPNKNLIYVKILTNFRFLAISWVYVFIIFIMFLSLQAYFPHFNINIFNVYFHIITEKNFMITNQRSYCHHLKSLFEHFLTFKELWIWCCSTMTESASKIWNFLAQKVPIITFIRAMGEQNRFSGSKIMSH